MAATDRDRVSGFTMLSACDTKGKRTVKAHHASTVVRVIERENSVCSCWLSTVCVCVGGGDVQWVWMRVLVGVFKAHLGASTRAGQSNPAMKRNARVTKYAVALFLLTAAALCCASNTCELDAG